MTGKLRPRRTDPLPRRGGRPPQQRVAVGAMAADHPLTDCTDCARYLSLWRLRHARYRRKPQDPGFINIVLVELARVRCDRFASAPKIEMTKETCRGAHTC